MKKSQRNLKNNVETGHLANSDSSTYTAFEAKTTYLIRDFETVPNSLVIDYQK